MSLREPQSVKRRGHCTVDIDVEVAVVVDRHHGHDTVLMKHCELPQRQRMPVAHIGSIAVLRKLPKPTPGMEALTAGEFGRADGATITHYKNTATQMLKGERMRIRMIEAHSLEPADFNGTHHPCAFRCAVASRT